jgi:predicted phage-related endonuclease
MSIEAVAIDALKAQFALLQYAKEKKAELNEIESSAKAAIQAALGDAEAGTIDGRIAVTWKVTKRRAIDQGLLKQNYPEVAEQCMTVSQSRRFEFVSGGAE